jgi:hypothetical protein
MVSPTMKKENSKISHGQEMSTSESDDGKEKKIQTGPNQSHSLHLLNDK